ncbi:response regulator transcription factor [Streptomyces sp. NPDC004596]
MLPRKRSSLLPLVAPIRRRTWVASRSPIVFSAHQGQRRELSPREQQVLAYISAGFTNQQTSRRLGISTSTVETYLNRVRTKLDAPTRAHLVRAAVNLGL